MLAIGQVGHNYIDTPKSDLANNLIPNGTYDLSGLMCAGHITSSGNYIIFTVPAMSTIGKTVTLDYSGISVQTADNVVIDANGMDSGYTTSVTTSFFGVTFMLKFSTTQSVNIPATVHFYSGSITVS